MKFIISAVVILVHLNSSVGLQDDTQQNRVHNEDLTSSKSPNQEYFYQQRPALAQQFSQHYVPVPIQLIQRSVHSMQPHAALIIVKAYPIYLSPSQSTSFQHGSFPNAQNYQMVNYSPAPKIPSYVHGQPTDARPVLVHPHQPVKNYVPATNPNIFYAPPANNVQGGSYYNQLAQIVAQQYSKSPSTYKTPAIVTGLENFSPEQQNQIKTHLKKYIDSHSDENSQQNDIAEHREIMSTGDSNEGKFSSRTLAAQYSQQTDWRPSNQESGTTVKHFGDKS